MMLEFVVLQSFFDFIDLVDVVVFIDVFLGVLQFDSMYCEWIGNVVLLDVVEVIGVEIFRMFMLVDVGEMF